MACGCTKSVGAVDLSSAGSSIVNALRSVLSSVTPPSLPSLPSLPTASVDSGNMTRETWMVAISLALVTAGAVAIVMTRHRPGDDIGDEVALANRRRRGRGRGRSSRARRAYKRGLRGRD